MGSRRGVGGSRSPSSRCIFLAFLLFANQKYTHVITASNSDKKLVDEAISDGNDKRNNIFYFSHCTFFDSNIDILRRLYKTVPLFRRATSVGRMVQTLSKELKQRWVLYRLNLHKLIHLYSTLELMWMILRHTTL